MRIKLTSVFVDDQDKALRFYTEVLGLVALALSCGSAKSRTVTRSVAGV
jgi:catechol 2,3-dioxygenase-like lactoylglutathione lyase family enzyme